jgi:pimeloyl-ACP methyl ester carboxylesterase
MGEIDGGRMMEGYVPVPGGRIHLRDTGRGAPIVLLHAGIVDSRAWEPVAVRLAAAGRAVAGTSETSRCGRATCPASVERNRPGS